MATLTEKRLTLYLRRMATDGMVPKGGRHLGCCPDCCSGDMSWCNISVRPYCRECNWWSMVNDGSADDALAWLRARQERAEVTAATI